MTHSARSVKTTPSGRAFPGLPDRSGYRPHGQPRRRLRDPEETELTPEEISGLLEVYRKDVMKADIRALDSETPAGELYLDVSSSDLESPGDPIIGGTDGFSGGNTDTALLATQTAGPDAAPAETEEALLLSCRILSLSGVHGYAGIPGRLRIHAPHRSPNPEDVDRIDVTLSKSSVQSGKYGELLSRLSDKAEYIQPRSSDGQLSVTEPGDIALVLDYLEPFGQRIIGPVPDLPITRTSRIKTGMDITDSG